MLKVDVETISPVRRRLTIEVPADQVAAEVESAYAELRRSARVKGFRPGRAPRPVLEKEYGHRLRADVVDRLMRASLGEALEEQHLHVVGEAQVATESAEPGGPLRFTATVETYPEVEARGYQDLKLESPVVRVSDDDVDRYLKSLQESFAQLRPVDDRSTVQPGDVAVIDYEGKVGERVIARGEKRPCEIGGGRFPEAFEARLLGAEVGQTLEFPVTYAADDPHEDLAGQTVQFRVLVRALALKDVPPLDDDFAKDHGECDTLAALRERVRQHLESSASRQAEEQVRSAAVSQLVTSHEFELPDAMVARETEYLMMDVVENWRSRRIWPKEQDSALAALRDELRPRARDQVKASLLLEAVARQENIEVTDEEVEAEVERSASAAGEAGERIRSLSARPEARQGLRERMRRNRALDWIVARADISKVERLSADVAGADESR